MPALRPPVGRSEARPVEKNFPAGRFRPPAMHPLEPVSLPVELRLADDVLLRIRAVAPRDRELIREGLARFSRQSTYQRFFTPVVTFSEAHLDYLTDVNGTDHVAIGALNVATGGEEGVGIARYIRLADAPHVAEAAISVLDAYQSRGIGSLLLAVLSQYAAAAGIEAFRAYVLADHGRFLQYLLALGAELRERDGGIVALDVPVIADGRQIPAGPATRTARWAWRRIQEAAPAP